MKALDQHTLQVTLSQPVPYFLSLLTHPSLSPLHRASMEQYGNQWTQPGKLVGNGAFVLSHRVVNEKLELTPNPYYWDRAHTVLTKVTFVPINQESAATNRYLAGDLHITESFPKEQYHKLMQQIPGEVYTPDQLGTYYYAFNTQRAPSTTCGCARRSPTPLTGASSPARSWAPEKNRPITSPRTWLPASSPRPTCSPAAVSRSWTTRPEPCSRRRATARPTRSS